MVLLITDEPILANFTVQSVLVLLYLVIVATGAGYVCYTKAIELADPSTASIAFFKPIVGILLSALILSEPITWSIVVGTLLIIIGFLFNLGVRPRRPAASASD